MQVLYLRHNLISGTLPPYLLANATELRYLMLQNNSFSGSIPTQVGMLKKLSDLHMYENALDQQVMEPSPSPSPSPAPSPSPSPSPAPAPAPSKLTPILTPTLHPQLPDEIGEMTMLQDLRLQDNRIPGTIPDTIGQLYRLRYLDLYGSRTRTRTRTLTLTLHPTPRKSSTLTLTMHPHPAPTPT